MKELLEEMKNHKLAYVFFHCKQFKVWLESGEEIQASSAELLTKFLRSLRPGDGEE